MVKDWGWRIFQSEHLSALRPGFYKNPIIKPLHRHIDNGDLTLFLFFSKFYRVKAV